MTRPTKFIGSVPLLGGPLGFALEDVEPEIPPPIDRALGSNGGYAFTVSAPSTSGIVQSASANISDTLTLPASPTAGNIVVVWVTARSPGSSDFTVPTGFTEIQSTVRTSSNSFFWRKGGMAYRVVVGGDSATIDTSSCFGGAATMKAAVEISGVSALQTSGRQTEQGPDVETDTGGSLVTSSGAVIVGGAVVGGTSGGTGGDGATALTASPGSVELADLRNNNNASPRFWFGYRIEEDAGTFSVAATQDDGVGRVWGGISGAFTSTASPVAWNVEAPNTVDGDDVTYHEIDGTNVLRVDLGAAYTIVSTRIVAGSATAQSVTYTITGANEADFSDGVALGNITFTSTGSFTADTRTFAWVSNTAYQYYELDGSDENRRIYTWSLYEADITEGQDHSHDDLQDQIDDLAEAIDNLGSGTLTVEEEDGSPSDTVDTLIFPNDSVTIDGTNAHIRQVPYGSIGCGLSTTSGAMTSGAAYTITFATEDWDTDGFHSTSTNTSRITIPAGLGGKYLFTGSTRLPTAGTGDVWGGFAKNSTYLTTGDFLENDASGSTDRQMSASVILDLVPGDFVEWGGLFTGLTKSDLRVTFTCQKLDSGKVGQGIGARVYNSASQTVTAGVETAMTFNSEEFDTDAFHDTVTNNTRFTIPTGLGGKYFVRAHLGFAGSHGVIFGRIKKNGTTFITGSEDDLVSGTDSSLYPGCVIDLVAGDYLEVFASRASGTSVGATTNSFSNAFEVFRLDSGALGDHTHATAGSGSTGGGASLAPTSFTQSTGIHVVGGVITSTIDADQNNYAPTGVHTKTTVYFDSFTANRTITGYDAGTEGEFLIFQNNTSFSLLLTQESASSTAANRFRLPNAATLTIRTRGSMLFVYIQGRWCAMLN